MKITVDKTMTSIAQLPEVKEDIKEFKATYSESDVVCIIKDFCGNLNGDLLSLEMDAFPRSNWDRDTVFFFTAFFYGWTNMYRVTGAFDMRLNMVTSATVHTYGDRKETTYQCES